VKKDTETMVAVHSNAFKLNASQLNCNQGGDVKIEITSPPKNGTVTMKPAKEKPANCTNELQGTGVFYKPNPGTSPTRASPATTPSPTSAPIPACARSPRQAARRVPVSLASRSSRPRGPSP
jgi:hypothetical protein